MLFDRNVFLSKKKPFKIWSSVKKKLERNIEIYLEKVKEGFVEKC